MSPCIRVELRRVLAVAGKDLLAEGRSKWNALSVILFAGTALLLFAFAFGPDAEALRNAGAGVIWLTLLLSGVLLFNRSYQIEIEGGAIDALLTFPGSRRSIYLGKLLANLVLLLMVAAVVLPVAGVLFHVPLQSAILGVLAIILFGALGLVTLGTFYAAISSRSRARDVLLPLLLFPMLVPLLLAAVQGTTAYLEGDAMGYGGAWLKLILAFDLIFLVAAVWAFDHVIEQ